MGDTGRRAVDQNQEAAEGSHDVFQQKVELLSATLQAVGSKCNLLGTRLVTAEEESKQFAER